MTTRSAVREVFGFYVSLGRRSGRTRTLALVGLIPVALAIVVRIVLRGREGDIAAVFSEILMVFFLQIYIVVLSLFYGTSIAAEEVENRTLAYLLTRPVPKTAVVLGKYAAYGVLMFAMTAIGLTASFVVLNASRLGDPALYAVLLKSLGVLWLGLLAYTALFAFFGMVLKRAIILGLIFGFGWETVIQYFPGSTQRFSIVHYLKSLLPFRSVTSSGKGLALLLFRLEPTPPLLAVLALFVIAAVFLALACGIFRAKEFLPED
jgi:ABC-2 type transport system permease protein